ncbi:hypothetical protein IWQ60_002818 [Tieghemiomyces parasiticus]|uniref:Kinesin motor domain-containing protein n=1 Tax=Tieghemiomyces parasiticus TaxID=78921 RepID=A0A9W8E0R6_9FUNG|nr:hypothetical protein IWQ60_002818 [Tieghemiomyces parasiticus]
MADTELPLNGGVASRRPQSPPVVPVKKRNKTPSSSLSSAMAPAGYQARQVFAPPQTKPRRSTRLSGSGPGENGESQTAPGGRASGNKPAGKRKPLRTKTTVLVPASHKPPPASISQTMAGAPRTPVTQRTRGDSNPARLPITPYTAKLTRTIENYDADKDPIKTYLRMRPLRPGSEHVEPFLSVVNDMEIQIDGREKRARLYTSGKYLFTRVFGSLMSQQALFQATTLPVIQELFDGYNTLIFAYGVTNSGKTYTIQGTREQPGIIPRTLEIILHHIKDAQSDCRVCPARANDVVYCPDDTLFSPTFRSTREHTLTRQALQGHLASDEHILNLDTAEFEYSIWVSYAEIYNEFIYDLLDLRSLVVTNGTTSQPLSHPGSRVNSPDPSATSRRPARRKGTGTTGGDHPPGLPTGGPSTGGGGDGPASPNKRLNMKIRTDVDDDHYLEGITEVRIRTLEDALAVLAHGQKRRTANSTLLNQESSRSHSIFTIKLLRIRRRSVVAPDLPVPPHMVQIQKMSIIDLAGSERAAKTQNTGDRLHEAGMINKSLMVLGNCLETLRFNQFKSDKIKPQIVPFRESQLTKLFQSSFMGGAKTVMLVNVNPFDDSYEETQRVLKFAAVAKDITTVNRPVAATPLYRAVLHSKPPVFGLYEDPPEQDRPPKRKRGALALLATGSDPSEVNSTLTSPSLAPSSPSRASSPTTVVDPRPLVLAESPTPGAEAAAIDDDHKVEDDTGTPREMDLVSPEDEKASADAPGFTFRFNPQPQAVPAPPAEDVFQVTRDAWEEQITYSEELRAAMSVLKEQFAAAQYRCSEIEVEVREELNQEYKSKLLEIEQRYNQQLRDEMRLNEEKMKSKIDILTRSQIENEASMMVVTPTTPEPASPVERAPTLPPVVVTAPCDHAEQLSEQDRVIVELRAKVNQLEIRAAHDEVTQSELHDQLDAKHADWQEEKTQRLLLTNQKAILEDELRRAKGIRDDCERRISTHSITYQGQVDALNQQIEVQAKAQLKERLEWERSKFELEATVADLRGQLSYEKEARRSVVTRDSMHSLHSQPRTGPASPARKDSETSGRNDNYDVQLLQQIQKLQRQVADRDRELNALSLDREEQQALIHDLNTKNNYLLHQMRVHRYAQHGGAAGPSGLSAGPAGSETPSSSKVRRVFQHFTPEAKSLRSPSVPTAMLSGLGVPHSDAAVRDPAAPRSPHLSQQQRLMKSSFLKKSLFGKKQLQFDEYEAEVLDLDPARQQVTGTMYRGPIMPTSTGGIHVEFADLAPKSAAGGVSSGRRLSYSSSDWGASDGYPRPPPLPTQGGGMVTDSPSRSSVHYPQPTPLSANPRGPSFAGTARRTSRSESVGHAARPAHPSSSSAAVDDPPYLRRRSSLDLDALRKHPSGDAADASARISTGLNPSATRPLGVNRAVEVSQTSLELPHRSGVPSQAHPSPSKRLLLSPWLEKAKATFRPKH